MPYHWIQSLIALLSRLRIQRLKYPVKQDSCVCFHSNLMTARPGRPGVACTAVILHHTSIPTLRPCCCCRDLAHGSCSSPSCYRGYAAYTRLPDQRKGDLGSICTPALTLHQPDCLLR